MKAGADQDPWIANKQMDTAQPVTMSAQSREVLMRSIFRCPTCGIECSISAEYAGLAHQQHREAFHPEPVDSSRFDWTACLSLVTWALTVVVIAYLL